MDEFLLDESNDDLKTLHEDYKDSEIYEEIKLFLDEFRPEWRKQKELGSWAPEFCLLHIRIFEDEYHEEAGENSIRQWLSNIYTEIAESYEDTKQRYQFVRLDHLTSEFDESYEDRHYDEDFDEEQYDRELNEFIERDGELIYFSF